MAGAGAPRLLVKAIEGEGWSTLKVAFAYRNAQLPQQAWVLSSQSNVCILGPGPWQGLGFLSAKGPAETVDTNYQQTKLQESICYLLK